MTGQPSTYIVMGVAGSGKTTIGKLLAERIGAQFSDADAFHSEENKRKMSNGMPLNDADRQPWLHSMRDAIQDWLDKRDLHVLACSALKDEYRRFLQVDDRVQFVYLKAPRELILQRLTERKHHYMKANMVESQFETLEEPCSGDAIVVDAGAPVAQVVQTIMDEINQRASAGQSSA